MVLPRQSPGNPGSRTVMRFTRVHEAFTTPYTLIANASPNNPAANSRGENSALAIVSERKSNHHAQAAINK